MTEHPAPAIILGKPKIRFYEYLQVTMDGVFFFGKTLVDMVHMYIIKWVEMFWVRKRFVGMYRIFGKAGCMQI